MRFPIAFAAMALLTAGAAPALSELPQAGSRGARDWSASIAATPQGGHLLGDPAAATKIVEYASYTCPHCAHFSAESKAELAPLIRSGRASIEYRHMIRDPLDLAATVVARCGGPRRFARLNDAIFAAQGVWLPRAAEFVRVNRATLAAAEPGAQLRGIAEGAGLLAIGRANGLTDAALQRCFADRAALDRLTALNKSIPAEVAGTPSFYVNGKLAGAHDWAGLRPLVVVR